MIFGRLLVTVTLLSFAGFSLAQAEDLRFMQPKPPKFDVTAKLSDGYVMSQSRLAQALANRFQAPILKIDFSKRHLTAYDDAFDLSFTVQKNGLHEVECLLRYNSWILDKYAFSIDFCETPLRNVEQFYLPRSKVTGAVKTEVFSANGQRRVIADGKAHSTGVINWAGRVLDLARLETALQSRLRTYVSKVVMDISSFGVLKDRYANLEFVALYQGKEITFKCSISNDVSSRDEFSIYACENDHYVLEGFELKADDVLVPKLNSTPNVLPEL